MSQWRDIPGYEGLYQISDEGQIMNVGPDPARHGKLIKTNCKWRHFTACYLTRDGVQNKFVVHTLMAMAWIPNYEYGCKIIHLDGDYTNNRLENLEFKSNRKRRERYGTAEE